MSEESSEAAKDQNDGSRALEHRLDTIGWALFLIMIGCLWLIPGEQVPQGTWLIGAGVIMIGVNLARSLNGIKMNGFTVVVGLIAIGFGVAGVLNIDLPLFAILIIIIGVNILIKLISDWVKQRPKD
jgi:hypothetical protein